MSIRSVLRISVLAIAVAAVATSVNAKTSLASQVKINPGKDVISPALTLKMTVEAALVNDPWLLGSQYSQQAMESLSVAAGTLPDPKISLGFSNLPSDTFNFAQEGMTQFKVGVLQVLPRGDSLAIKQKQLKLNASQYPFQQKDRQAKVTVTVTHLWLEAYKAQQSIALIEHDRSLFDQLAQVAQASYSSAVGKTSQQDVIRAQLELVRLDDRLTLLKQHKDMAIQRLNEWVSGYLTNANFNPTENLSAVSRLDSALPNIALLNPHLYRYAQPASLQSLSGYLSEHAAVKNLQQKIQASNTSIALAKQNYKPQWALNASYGYRDQDPMGNDRSDLFSMGVSFDLPLFTSNRQDQQLQAAVAKTEAVRTDKWLLIRKLMASFETARTKLFSLRQRSELYQSQLLPQMHEQAQASLSAYTSVNGDFSEVVRARIAELNANIDALAINVDLQKSRAQLNYFFMKEANQIIAVRSVNAPEGEVL